MNKSEASALLAEITVSPITSELHQLLCASQERFVNIKKQLKLRIDPRQFTRLYSDIASACIHQTVGTAQWAESQASSRIEKHGGYPRARIDHLDRTFIFTSNGKASADYIKNAMSVNSATGTAGARCIQVDYKLNGANGIGRAVLIIPSGDGTPLVQTELYPSFGPAIAIG